MAKSGPKKSSRGKSMDEMKALAAAVKELREAIQAGDWFAALKATAAVVVAMANAGQIIVGPFLPTANAASTDVENEIAALELACVAPALKTASTAAGFDWTMLMPLILQLIELWRSKK